MFNIILNFIRVIFIGVILFANYLFSPRAERNNQIPLKAQKQYTGVSMC